MSPQIVPIKKEHWQTLRLHQDIKATSNYTAKMQTLFIESCTEVHLFFWNVWREIFQKVTLLDIFSPRHFVKWKLSTSSSLSYHQFSRFPKCGLIKELDQKVILASNYSQKFTDFCPLGCNRPIKNINFYAKFPKNPFFISKKVTLN